MQLHLQLHRNVVGKIFPASETDAIFPLFEKKMVTSLYFGDMHSGSEHLQEWMKIFHCTMN